MPRLALNMHPDHATVEEGIASSMVLLYAFWSMGIVDLVTTSVLVPTSKAPVASSDALVPSSEPCYY